MHTHRTIRKLINPQDATAVLQYIRRAAPYGGLVGTVLLQPFG
jgi:hypothetical protein